MNHKLLLLLTAFSLSCGSPTKQEALPETTQAIQTQFAPLALETSITDIAFGSCVHQKQPQPIWETVISQNPQLFIAMGDNVYASKPEDKPIATQYELQARVPEYQKFRAQVPMIGIWDDHDFGKNDGGADNPEKDEAKIAYLNFFPTDAARISPYQKGVYHSFILGQAPRRVQIVMLDTRYFRSPLEKNLKPKHKLDIFQPTQDPNQTILGDEQWTWLEDELSTPAEVRLIVSSIQIIPEEHGFEKWANFPKERKRFFDLLKKTKAKNVFILSGDRHLAEISQMRIPGVGNILDITASALNRPSNLTEEKNKYRLGQFYPGVNFGAAQIDWNNNNITFHIVDLEGKKVLTAQQKIEILKQSHTSK